MSRVRSVLSYAIRDASRHRVILALIIVSLSISSVSVYVTNAILDGFKSTLTSGAIDSNGHLIITPNDDQTQIYNSDQITKVLSKIDNVSGYSIRSKAIGGIKYSQKIVASYAFMGFDEKYEGNTTKIPDSLIEGSFFAPTAGSIVFRYIMIALPRMIVRFQLSFLAIKFH